MQTLPALRKLVAIVPLLGLLGACGTASEGAGPGKRCTESDACAAGLSCLDPSDTFVAMNDAGCSGATAHGITICTKICGGDEDCAAFGAEVVCASNGCGDTGICLVKSDAGAKPGKP